MLFDNLIRLVFSIFGQCFRSRHVSPQTRDEEIVLGENRDDRSWNQVKLTWEYSHRYWSGWVLWCSSRKSFSIPVSRIRPSARGIPKHNLCSASNLSEHKHNKKVTHQIACILSLRSGMALRLSMKSLTISKLLSSPDSKPWLRAIVKNKLFIAARDDLRINVWYACVPVWHVLRWHYQADIQDCGSKRSANLLHVWFRKQHWSQTTFRPRSMSGRDIRIRSCTIGDTRK